jgi:F-type H+-transporting ATPase subunit delta
MSDTMVARRYARALHDTAETRHVSTDVDRDIAMIDESLRGSAELVRFFYSPIVSRERKAAVVRSLFGDRVNPLTQQFLELLVTKRRESVFPEVVRAYRHLRDEQLGMIEATARTARSLSADDEAGLRFAIERRTGKRVRLTVQLDTTLLGGVIVRVGDTVYDGSVRNRLVHLRDRFGQGSVHTN